MKTLLLALALILWVAVAEAQVAFDATVNIAGKTTTPQTTGSLTIASGSNRLLVCVVFQQGTSTTPNTVSSIAWDAAGVNEALTQFTTNVGTQTANFQRIDVWRRIAPTAKTATITATLSATATEWGMICTSWTGVDQTTPLAGSQYVSNAFGGGATKSFTLVTVSGDMGIIVGATNFHAVVSVTGTQDGIDSTGTGGNTYIQWIAEHSAASSTSTSVSVTFDTANDGQDAQGFVIKQAAGAATKLQLKTSSGNLFSLPAGTGALQQK